MSTETETKQWYGWSATGAKIYHRPKSGFYAATTHYSACYRWVIDRRTTDKASVPDHLTPCRRCFPPPKTP